jgi:3-isopropylmalate/(R)-2-methylmalate dehydratase small subunit
MTLAKIERVVGTGVHLAGEDIDTDRILPGRFLKCVSFDGLGERLFYDARFDQNGKKTDHVLHDARFQGATVLLVDRNFGCGSSREHAPQALTKWGFRALIGESFAEIFFGNATTLGLPCVAVDRSSLDRLAAEIAARPQTIVTVDLRERAVLTDAGTRLALTMPDGAREALLLGKWDPIGELWEARASIRSMAAALPYVSFRPPASRDTT